VAAALEDRQEAGDVAVDVRLRISERVANASLRCQVDNTVESVRAEERRHARPVLDRQLSERKPVATCQPRHAVTLQGWRVIRVEVVDAEEVVTVLQQPGGDKRADESGRSGDEDPHG
jgi:hypothetical protein